MMWDSVLSDKPLIAAPRKLDRPLVLSHSRGLQSKGFSSQSLESCANYPQNHRQILESCVVRVARKSVIASGVSRAAIHTKKQGVCNE